MKFPAGKIHLGEGGMIREGRLGEGQGNQPS